MGSLGLVLLVFAAVQSAFVALDVLTLRSDARAGRAPALRGVGRPVVLFLAAVWLGYFVLQNALMAVVPSVDRVLAWLGPLAGHPGPADRAGPLTLATLLAGTYVVAGFWDYALHRWLLHGRWGWFLHENHHLPTVVANGIPGISVRPFVAVTAFLTYLGTTASVLAALRATGTGGLVEDFVRCLPAMIVALTCVGSASHSPFLRRRPWVHALLRPFFLTTPQEHVLHHGVRLHGNYGNFTTLWDRVFGTYIDPRAAAGGAIALGLRYDQDFLGTLTAGRWKLPESVRRRYRLDAFCHLEPGGPR